MFHRIASALRRTLRIAGESRRATLWTLLVLVCAATAAGIGGIAARSIDRARATPSPTTGASMVVYLTDTASSETAHGLLDQITKISGVERAELVTSEETAKRLTRELGETLHDDVALRGLPVSIEVSFAPGVHDVIALSPTIQALRTAAGVEDIAVAEDVAPVPAIASMRGAAWIGAALFGGLALVIVLATVRVRLERGRQERAVAEILGADPGFFAIPTALAGALQATIAAIVAGTLVYLATMTWGADAAVLLGNIAIELPEPAEIGIFVGALATLGLVGGALAGIASATRPVRKFA